MLPGTPGTAPPEPVPPAPVPDPARLPRCPESAWGYDPAQVEALLAAVRARLAVPPPAAPRQPSGLTSEHVRGAVFDRVRGGCRTEPVDRALDAAEDALARLEREHFLREHGPEAWQRRLDELTALLRGRLDRPRTRRFRRPAHVPGYSAAHVDVLCERLAEHLDGRAQLAPDAARRAVFPRARGERSYEEHQVDAFLDRAVQLLLAHR